MSPLNESYNEDNERSIWLIVDPLPVLSHPIVYQYLGLSQEESFLRHPNHINASSLLSSSHIDWSRREYLPITQPIQNPLLTPKPIMKGEYNE